VECGRDVEPDAVGLKVVQRARGALVADFADDAATTIAG
jgi:hypothetical protein